MIAKRVLVVGAGIVGCALARELAAASSVEVTVLEASAEGRLVGSTGYAPGFIGTQGSSALANFRTQSSATTGAGPQLGHPQQGKAEMPSAIELTVHGNDIQMSGIKTARMNVRLAVDADERIRKAAQVSGLTMSAFVEHAASAAADTVLADRREFLLDAENWDQFVAALDRPARDLPELRRGLELRNQLTSP